MNFFLVRTSRYSLRVTLMADVCSSYDSACKSVAVLSAGVVLLAKVPWDIFVLCWFLLSARDSHLLWASGYPYSACAGSGGAWSRQQESTSKRPEQARRRAS